MPAECPGDGADGPEEEAVGGFTPPAAPRFASGSARIQIVRDEPNHSYYDIVMIFQTRGRVPIPIDTSFNARGEPVVYGSRDALACFATTPIDALAVGPFLLEQSWSP